MKPYLNAIIIAAAIVAATAIYVVGTRYQSTPDSLGMYDRLTGQRY